MIAKTSKSFVDCMDKNLKVEQAMDKREYLASFKEQSSEEISSHHFTKTLKEYAEEIFFEYEDRSTGGKYLFRFKDTSPNKDKNE